MYKKKKEYTHTHTHTNTLEPTTIWKVNIVPVPEPEKYTILAIKPISVFF